MLWNFTGVTVMKEKIKTIKTCELRLTQKWVKMNRTVNCRIVMII